MDVKKNRLKLLASNLGTGTANSSTYLKGDGTWGTIPNPDLSPLENTAAMLAWDTYSQDIAFDDMYADDLTDETGIDLTASTGGVYDSAGAYWRSGQPTGTGLCDVTTSSSIDIQNLKISTHLYWQKTATSVGYFSSDAEGSSRVTVGAGNTEANIVPGVNLVYATGTSVVVLIISDGSHDGDVSLNVDIADGTEITAINSATISSSQLTSMQTAAVEALAWSGKLATSGTPPSQRRGGSCAYYNNYIYICGGNDLTNAFSWFDVHRFNITTNTWSDTLTCSGTPPTTGYGQSAIVYNGLMYVFGGFNGSASNNAVYTLNLTTLEWVSVSTSGTPPSIRYSHSAVYYLDGSTPYMYVFGGTASGTKKQDVHRLNLSTNAWSGELTTSGTPPSGRYQHSAGIYNGSMYVACGNDGSGKNDIHTLNLSTLAWSGAISCTGTPPTARYGQSGVIYNGYFYVYGGYVSATSSEVHRLNLSTLVWSGAITTSGGTPLARCHFCSAQNSGIWYHFGGWDNSSTYYNRTDSFDLTNLEWFTLIDYATCCPTPRSRYSSWVYGNDWYVWGGYDGTTYFNDLYKFNFTTQTWSGVLPVTGTLPSGRYGASAVVYGNYVYIFGGVTPTNQQDTHRINLSTLSWSGTLTTTGTKPAFRQAHTAQVYGNLMYIFGGGTGLAATGSIYNDVCCLNLDSLAWQTIYNAPLGRDGSGCVLYSGYLYVFGGFSTTNEVHRYNLSTGLWSNVLTCSGTPPTARYSFSTTLYGNLMYVFGGYNGSTRYNDLLCLNLDTLAWSTPTTSGTPPSTRYGHSGTLVGDYWYVFGGYTTTYVNDLHRINLSTLAWSGALSPSGTPPSARRYHSAALSGNYIYVFGGYTGSSHNDLHRLDISNPSSLAWSGALSPSGNIPIIRYSHRCDVVGDYMYLFGGWDGTTHYNDLYRLNISNPAAMSWSDALSSTGNIPTARYGASSFVSGNSIYYYGGCSPNISVNDIRILDVSNPNSLAWTTTYNAPYPRSYSLSVLADGYLYIITGWDGFYYFNDVCRYNLSTGVWSDILTCTGTPPTARYGAAAALVDGYLYAFGGKDASVANNDFHRLNLSTLTWSGALSPTGTVPPATYYIKGVYNGGYFYTWGGYYSSTTYFNGTYRIGGTFTPASLTSAITTNNSQINVSSWEGIATGAVTQTTPGSSHVYHAVSFDGRSTWKVFVSGAWRSIVQFDSVWQYNNSATSTPSWQNATTNTCLAALTQAFGVAANQWTKVAVEALSSANWSDTGGFTIAATTLDWAVGLLPDGANVPLFDKITFTWMGAWQDIVFVTNSWEASVNDPKSGYCVLDIEPTDAITPNTDLKAYVTIDDGSHYEQITLEALPFREVGVHDYIRGDISSITARTDKTIRLKLTSHNTKALKIHGVANGVKY